MANVPVVKDFSVESNPTPKPSINISTNNGMFNSMIGVDKVGKGLSDVSEGIDNYRIAVQKAKDKANDVLAIQTANDYDNFAIDQLYNPDSGLFSKGGGEYLNSMNTTLDNLSKETDHFLKDLDPQQQAVVGNILDKKYNTYKNKILEKSVSEKENFNTGVLNNFIKNQTELSLKNYNSSDLVQMNIASVNGCIQTMYYGKLDQNQIQDIQRKTDSKILETVLDTRIGNFDPYARKFFETFKNQIDPSKYDSYYKQINDLEIGQGSRTFADNCLTQGVPEEEAYQKALEMDKKHNTNVFSSTVTSKYSKVRSMENQAYQDKKNMFWDNFIKNPDATQIPSWLKGTDKKTALAYAKQGGGKSSLATYEKLFHMKVTNADAFSKINLNDYRSSLSNSEFKEFFKMQENIKNHKYSSFTPDDERVLEVADATFKIKNDGRKKALAGYTQKLINQEERRIGRQLTEKEQNKFFEYMGYKGGKQKTFDIIENHGARADFYKKAINDVEYFKSVNGRMPNSQEFNQMLYKNAAKATINRNQQIKSSVQQNHSSNNSVYMGHRITSAYGSRTAPINGATSYHRGLDLAYNNNEPFKAFSSGKVINVSYDSKLGKFVDIKSSDGTIHRYGHANSILVNKGQTVHSGMVIGRAGTSGVTTGPHVHYAQLKNGKYVNPLEKTMIAGTVRMKAPNGRIYNVPVGKVASYEKIGGVKL